MSFVRLLVSSNQFDIEALVATTSRHLRNSPRPDVLRSVIDAYGKVQPNLAKHEAGISDGGRPGQARGGRAGQLRHGRRRRRPHDAWRRGHRPRGGFDRSAAAVGLGLGRREHARAGVVARAGDAARGRPGARRRQAARLHDFGSGRCRAVAAARVSDAPLHRHAGRHERLPRRDVDGDCRRRVLSQRRGRRLHDGVGSLGRRAHAQEGAAGRVLSAAVLHHRRGHAGVPEPDEQRARVVHESDVRRMGRAIRVAAALARDAAVLDQLARLARHRGRAPTARATRPTRRRSGDGARRFSTTSPRAWTGRSRTSRRPTTIRTSS